MYHVLLRTAWMASPALCCFGRIMPKMWKTCMLYIIIILLTHTGNFPHVQSLPEDIQVEPENHVPAPCSHARIWISDGEFRPPSVCLHNSQSTLVTDWLEVCTAEKNPSKHTEDNAQKLFMRAHVSQQIRTRENDRTSWSPDVSWTKEEWWQRKKRRSALNC